MTDLMRMDRDGEIGILRFLQPHRRNPYSLDFVDALIRSLADAEGDGTMRAVVMTGGAHFSSGGDLVSFRSEIAKGARATHDMQAGARPTSSASRLSRLSTVSLSVPG
jgi:2-(1,2-epoxy-1,2-dihydrophenyl)acetyl-CoA isomerase